MSSGKLVLKGKVKLISPLLIGGGESDESDIDVIKDKKGNPFIPATSFIGVLRHYLEPHIDKAKLNNFWGYSLKKESLGSSVSCSDLALDEEQAKVIIRDGVRIDSKKGMAKDKGKYDYEVIERGVSFKLRMTANYNDEVTKEFAKRMFGTIKSLLTERRISLGAKSNNGLGKVELSDSQIYDYDFSNKKNVLAWLTNTDGSKMNETDKFEIKDKSFVIDSFFDLKTSLIVKSYPSDPNSPDSINIKSNGQNVLPGTSIKGAIRARAERILKTKFDDDKANLILNDLFGFVEDDKDRDSKAIRSRVKVEEYLIPPGKFVEEIQSRIKIDRFTGGTIAGALFDSMPLFRKEKSGKEDVINIKIILKDAKDYEKGLMLLVLKDLWTGDLAIGGEKSVGRGVLEGVHASIDDGNALKIEINDTLINDPKEQSNRDTLQEFVEALNGEVENGKK
ncbi:MAG: RAMP superfamily CRISPR-associated protein [bacterium]|nr:RAMP superfamily CRISPR-associated protein [bacterium]